MGTVGPHGDVGDSVGTVGIQWGFSGDSEGIQLEHPYHSYTFLSYSSRSRPATLTSKLKDQPSRTYGDNGDSVAIVGKLWIHLGQWTVSGNTPIIPMLFVIFFPFTASNFIIKIHWVQRGFIGYRWDLVVTVGVQWKHCKPIPVMKTGFSRCSISHRDNLFSSPENPALKTVWNCSEQSGHWGFSEWRFVLTKLRQIT